MVRKLRHKETLVYYDLPQLLVGEDPFGVKYICLLGATSEDYLCTAISLQRLQDFYMGLVDLRTVFSSPEVKDFFLVSFLSGEKEGLLKPFDGVPTGDWLPEPEFFYSMPEKTSDTVLTESIARNKAMIYFSISPPESRLETKISVHHLIESLGVFQATVRHSFSKVAGAERKRGSRAKSISEESLLEVVGFSPGSFTVHLQSTTEADMFGYIAISEALRRIDELSNYLNDKEKVLDILRENKGHFANSYIRLLRTIVKNDAPLRYVWAIPELSEPVSRSIDVALAEPLCELFATAEELTREELILEGEIIKADTKLGAWTLRVPEDEKEYKGFLSEDSIASLSGVVMETQRYRFHCEERIEEILGSGRELTKIYLTNYEKI